MDGSSVITPRNLKHPLIDTKSFSICMWMARRERIHQDVWLSIGAICMVIEWNGMNSNWDWDGYKILEIRIDKMKNIIEPLTICYCVVIQLLKNMLIIVLCIPSFLPLYWFVARFCCCWWYAVNEYSIQQRRMYISFLLNIWKLLQNVNIYCILLFRWRALLSDG